MSTALSRSDLFDPAQRCIALAPRDKIVESCVEIILGARHIAAAQRDWVLLCKTSCRFYIISVSSGACYPWQLPTFYLPSCWTNYRAGSFVIMTCDKGPESMNRRLSANALTLRFGPAMCSLYELNVIQSNPLQKLDYCCILKISGAFLNDCLKTC